MKLYKERDRYGIVALVMGIIGMLAWAIPIISIFVNIICIYCAIIGIDSRHRAISVGAVILGILGVVLTIFRSALVFFVS